MKKLNKFFIALMSAGILASCSSDNAPDEIYSGSEITDPCVVQLKIKLPETTRADSDIPTNVGNPSTEEGSANENKINDMLLVLASSNDNGFVDCAEITVATGTNVQKATFSRSVLTNYLNGISTNTVNAFVFCNVNETFKNHIKGLTKNSGDKEWYNQYCQLTTADKDGAWNQSVSGKIPMSNSEIYTAVLPTAANLSIYNSESNPWYLSGGGSNTTPINIERSIARLDFKDGSGNYFTYTIYDFKNNTNNALKENTQIKVKLEYMGLVNMSSKYYYLRHMAPMASNNTSADLTKVSLLDPETASNWVIDVDASNKSSEDYFFPLMDPTGTGNPNRTNWYATKLSDFASSHDEDHVEWNGGEGYRVWRYVTENTIPTISEQKNGNTTGIVFKAKLIIETSETENTKYGPRLKKSMEDGKTLFFFGDTKYPVGDADYIKTLAENAPERVAYEASLTDGVLDKGEATKNGFTLYEAVTDQNKLPTDDKGNYYMYYYYWNRHRDNDKPGVMGAMEFGTVRNFIYKLAVTDIKNLGHPRIKENDPDPVDPDDPDESDNLAIVITVKTVKWGVRVNNIKF